MKVAIKERHIRNGEKCSGSGCPLALAIHDKFDGENLGIEVSNNEVLIHWAKEDVFYAPDEAGKKFISDFDMGYPVEPIKIELIREGKWTGLRDIDYD